MPVFDGLCFIILATIIDFFKLFCLKILFDVNSANEQSSYFLVNTPGSVQK